MYRHEILAVEKKPEVNQSDDNLRWFIVIHLNNSQRYFAELLEVMKYEISGCHGTVSLRGGGIINYFRNLST